MRLYNRLEGETYRVESWPDNDSSKKNIDALCRNGAGRTLAVEHTLIEPFAGNKADIDPFLKTLGALEDHSLLKQRGYMLIASQPVGAVPRGIKWVDVPQLMVPQLAAVLPGLPEGLHTVTVTGPRWSLDLNVSKRKTAPRDPFWAKGSERRQVCRPSKHEPLGRFLGLAFRLGFLLRPGLGREFLLHFLADRFGVHLVQSSGVLQYIGPVVAGYHAVAGRRFVLFVQLVVHDLGDARQLIEHENSGRKIDLPFRGDGGDLLAGIGKADFGSEEEHRVFVDFE